MRFKAFFLLFFQVHLQVFLYEEKNVSRISKLYLLLFSSKTSIVGQLGDFQRLNIKKLVIWQLFFKSLTVV